jgi:hypothetical protein
LPAVPASGAAGDVPGAIGCTLKSPMKVTDCPAATVMHFGA